MKHNTSEKIEKGDVVRVTNPDDVTITDYTQDEIDEIEGQVTWANPKYCYVEWKSKDGEECGDNFEHNELTIMYPKDQVEANTEAEERTKKGHELYDEMESWIKENTWDSPMDFMKAMGRVWDR